MLSIIYCYCEQKKEVQAILSNNNVIASGGVSPYLHGFDSSKPNHLLEFDQTKNNQKISIDNIVQQYIIFLKEV